MGKQIRQMVFCLWCGTPFIPRIWDYRKGYGKYCGKICKYKAFSKSRRGEKHPLYGTTTSEDTKLKISKALKGRVFSEETKQKMSRSALGNKNNFYGRSHNEEARLKQSKANRGEKNPNWKGGVSREPYCFVWLDKDWRDFVLIRDKDKCCWNPLCKGKSNKPNLHHIDYDKKNCSYSNIIKICCSCNGRANFNRKFWQTLYTELIKIREIPKEYYYEINP